MTANPPTSLTMDLSLRNQVVRLECPSELEEGEWDGPIYARLLEPRHIKPGHPSVFVVAAPADCVNLSSTAPRTTRTWQAWVRSKP
ncbi:hypothetical protein DVH05_008864 [Phytophthora capsici]|nr:hypothetical protein DVH05_008864 [Phytophthora capsici]